MTTLLNELKNRLNKYNIEATDMRVVDGVIHYNMKKAPHGKPWEMMLVKTNINISMNSTKGGTWGSMVFPGEDLNSIYQEAVDSLKA